MSDDLQTPAFLQHLSGTAEEPQREALERALLENDELFEQCKALETEAVDAWARGELDSLGARSITTLLSVSPRLQSTMETTLALEHRAKDTQQHNIANDPRATTATARHGNRWMLLTGLLAAAALIASLWALRQQHTMTQQMSHLLEQQAALQAQFDTATEELSRVTELQRALEHYLARQQGGGLSPKPSAEQQLD